MSRPEKCLYEIEWHHKIACKPHYDKAEAKKCLFNDTTTDTVIDLQPLLNFTVNTVSCDCGIEFYNEVIVSLSVTLKHICNLA